MATKLTKERKHELDVILYLRELKKQATSGHHMLVGDVIRWVTDSFNRYLYIHEKPLVREDTVYLILTYGDVELWEWVLYLKDLGFSPNATATWLNIEPRMVSNIRYRNYLVNKNTLQRWLNKNETWHDLHSLRETTEVSQLVVPSRNFGSLLFESS